LSNSSEIHKNAKTKKQPVQSGGKGKVTTSNVIRIANDDDDNNKTQNASTTAKQTSAPSGCSCALM
jgi:hypothetical protein